MRGSCVLGFDELRVERAQAVHVTPPAGRYRLERPTPRKGWCCRSSWFEPTPMSGRWLGAKVPGAADCVPIRDLWHWSAAGFGPTVKCGKIAGAGQVSVDGGAEEDRGAS